MSSPVHPVSLLAVGAAAPSLRLTAADVGAAWGSGGGRGQVAVCDADEDTLTLAFEAAETALAAAGLDAGELDGLWWGTTRPPFAEGPSHTFLATALGIDPGAAGGLSAGSPHAGMDALLAAWDALAAGHAGTVLVVASDALLPGPGTAGESTTGAGAAALVLTGDNGASNGSGPPARLLGRASRVRPALDRYRGDRGAATVDTYDGRLFREQVFLPLLEEVGRVLAGTDPNAAPEAWAMSDPDGKLASAVARRLGSTLASTPVQAALGDTGAASPLLGLVQALAGRERGAVGMIGFGGGRATGVTVAVSRSLPGADRIGAVLAGGRPVSYTTALRARGQLEAMTEPVPMGVPPGSAAFVRGNQEMLALEGARCRGCATISTPPSVHPTCTGCGGTDLQVVALARRGTVQTFIVNQTMPAPFLAPLPMVIVDLEDGARLLVQGSPADAADLAIDDEVVLRLRRYAVERGVPVYGYTAFRSGLAPAPVGAVSTVRTGEEGP